MLAGALAADGQTGAAEENYAEAARLDPGNPVHMANLAALRLSAGGGNLDDARATLEKLAASPSAAMALPAIRGLLRDALRQHDPARVVRFRAALAAQAGRTLDDELSCIATAPGLNEAQAELAALWTAVAHDPPEALKVAEWMIHRGEAATALDWLRKLPAQSDTGVQMGEADAMAALGDWTGLRSFLETKNWHDCEFLRIVMLVRCARATNAAAPAWRDAIAACHDDDTDLLLLAQCVASWSWQTEQEALYWQIAQLGYPGRGPALKALWEFYNATGNTAGLLRVAHEQYADMPGDITASNNFAFLSLLTGIGRADADRLAEENFRAQGGNANVAATYAYSLYLDGRYQEGLRVLGNFDPHRLEAAGAALYLAILQKAAGDDQAASQSAAGVDATRLLPEEKLLLDKIGPKDAHYAKDHS